MGLRFPWFAENLVYMYYDNLEHKYVYVYLCVHIVLMFFIYLYTVGIYKAVYSYIILQH